MISTYLLTSSFGVPKKVPVHFSAFADKDIHCVIQDVQPIKNNSVLVVHRLYPDQNEELVKLLLLIDLLKDLGATKLSVFCPYLPYSRQDKRYHQGEALGAYTLCKVLASVGCAYLYTLDCHFMKGKAEDIQSGLHIKSVPASPYLLQELKKDIGVGQFEVIGPDEGSQYLTEAFGAKHMKKRRGGYNDFGTNNIQKREIVQMTDCHLKLTHPTVVIIDDIISSGATLLRAIENLHSRGLTDVYCAATHGIFLGNSHGELTAQVQGIAVSDSILQPSALCVVDKVLTEIVIPDWLAH